MLPEFTHPAQLKTRRSLTALGSQVVDGYDKRLAWYHTVLAKALEGAIRYVRYKGERGGYARVCISMPPRHGKSLHSELLAALALGIDPDLKIMCVGSGAELAKRRATNTRAWMEHPNYGKAFSTQVGKVEQVIDGERKVIEAQDAAHIFRTLKPINPENPSRGYVVAKGYLYAQGLGGSITGSGFDIGILDDLVKNAEQAQSETYHGKLWGFYASTFDTRAETPFSVQIYIGTRWTEPDFADELVEHWENELGDPSLIKVIRFPAIAEEPLEANDPREVGEGLDLVFRSTRFYAGKKRALMAREPWAWHGPWQQRPKAGGARLFQPSCWMPFTEGFPLTNLTYVDVSIDANLSETGASFAVIEVVGILLASSGAGADAGEHYFLLDESRGHYENEELQSEFVRLFKKWSTALPNQSRMGTVWVENKALGPTLISKFSGSYPIVAVPKVKNKKYCYRLASQITGQMRFRIPTGTWGKDPTDPSLPLVTDEWVGNIRTKGSWVHEMASFPSRPDDRRDAIAQVVICRDRTLGIHLLGVT